MQRYQTAVSSAPAGGTRGGARRPALTAAVIDAETSSRLGLPLLLPDVEFVGLYETTEQFLADPPQASVVVMDLHLAGIGQSPIRQRLDAVRAVVDAGYRVCVYTGERTNTVLVAALVAGAQGIVHKAESMNQLATALHQVAGGESVVTSALAGLAELADRRHLIPTLTPRQQQVLSARARGEKFESSTLR